MKSILINNNRKTRECNANQKSIVYIHRLSIEIGGKMRCRGCIIEYDLNEAAKILNITSVSLKKAVQQGKLKYWYYDRKSGYKFHNATLEDNRLRL